MKLATRINSFLSDDRTILQALEAIGGIEGITYVDLNYPEHFSDVSVEEMKSVLAKNNLQVNGLALRYRDVFRNGELGNSRLEIAGEAKELCKEAIDAVKALGGNQITVWLGYDGFDYSFQLDYAKTWTNVVEAFREICDVDPSVMVSIEYKPYQPRAFSLIADIGTTLLMIHEVNRDNIGVTLDFCHMLMKDENPAYGLVLAGSRGKLYGVHLNDGHHLNDDGLMVGTVNFIQTIEFLYYMKKYNYNGVIYFDTFPVRECPTRECAANVKLLERYLRLVDQIGMDVIQSIIDRNDAVAAQEIFLSCLR